MHIQKASCTATHEVFYVCLSLIPPSCWFSQVINACLFGRYATGVRGLVHWNHAYNT